MLVTDKASIFTSGEFKSFTKQNGIHHVTSAPYHPASNGLAECAVQAFKEFIKKTSGDPINTATFDLDITLYFNCIHYNYLMYMSIIL